MIAALLLAWTMPWNADSAMVYRRRQSETWIAHHAEMQADPIAWAHYWPAVHREADSLRVMGASRVTPADWSRAFQMTVPDSAGTYYVFTSNRYGTSGASNGVGR